MAEQDSAKLRQEFIINAQRRFGVSQEKAAQFWDERQAKKAEFGPPSEPPPSEVIAQPTRQSFQSARETGGALGVAGALAGNIAGSASDLAQNLATPLLHPVQTAKGLGTVGAGLAEKLVPGTQEHEAAIGVLGDALKERYGSIDALKKTAFEDPVGFALDASLLLGATAQGVKLSARAAGVPAIVGDAAAARVGQVAGAIDPIAQTGRAVGAIGRGASKATEVVGGEVLAKTTGTSPEIIREAVANERLIPSARRAVSGFEKGLKGEADQLSVIEASQDALSSVKGTLRAKESERITNLASQSTQQLTIAPAVQKFNQLLKDGKVKRLADGKLDFVTSRIQNPRGRAAIQQLDEVLTAWTDFSPTGVHDLKLAIDDIFVEGNRATGVVSEVRRVVRDELSKVAGYDQATRQIETGLKAIRDMERAFSLNDKAASTTIINKLSRSVKQNNDIIPMLREELDAAAGIDITGTLAGQAMRPAVSTSLPSIGLGVGAGVGAASNPAYLGVLALASPRVVANFLSSLGYTRKQIGSITKFLKENPVAKAATSAPARGGAVLSGRAVDKLLERENKE